MADALEVDKVPDFLQDIQLDIEETVYINGIPEKEYYSMTVDVSDDAGKNDEEEKEEAFEFLSEKEAGQFVNIGAGLVLGDQKENKEEEKKEAKKNESKEGSCRPGSRYRCRWRREGSVRDLRLAWPT